MSEPINNGELLLPVCIPESEIPEILSALDLYRVLKKGGQSSVAFDAVMASLKFLDNPQDSPCLDIENSNICWSVDTTNSAIRFHHNDPFVSIDKQKRPPIGQWERWDDSLNRPPEWIQNLIDLADDLPFFSKNIGYFLNDCFVVAPDENANDVTQFFDTLNALKNLDFPYFEVEVRGTGELELHLLKVPFGGSAIIVWDIEFNIWDFLWDLVNGGSSPNDNIIQTELEREITTLPPEANEENVIEIDFTEDIDHVVRCYFVPRIDYTALDFLGNGGGIREISACDGLTLISPDGDSITKDNFRLQEYIRRGFIMTTREDIRWAVHHGMVDAWADAVAGRGDGETSNIEYPVEIGVGGGIELDKTGDNTRVMPDIQVESELELVAGGVHGQASNFADLFVNLNLYIGTYTLETIQSVSRSALGVASDASTTLDGLISTYVTADPDFTIVTESLAGFIYESGDFLAGVRNYALSLNNETDLNRLIDFSSQVPSNTYREWYQLGQKQPSLAYKNYPSTLRETFDWIIYPEDTSMTITPFEAYTNAGKRKIRVSSVGAFTDGTAWRDLLFYSDDGVTINRQNIPSLFFKSGGTNTVFFPDTAVYNPSHIYRWDFELDNANYGAIHHDLPTLGFVDNGNDILMRITDLGLV